MINKILFYIVVFSLFSLAQEDKKQDQNVELPDFVITGNESVSIEKAKKIQADFGSAISEEFLKPPFPADKLELRNFNNPIKENINLRDSVRYLKGRINAALGLYSIPEGDVLFTNPFIGGIFEWFASTDNQKAFISNSDKYDLAGGLNLSLYRSNSNSFLPGTEIKFHGNYNLNSYKFYGSTVNPFQRRILNGGDVSLNVNNYLNDYFVFAASLDNEFNSLKNENYSENFLKFNGFGKIALSAFNLSFDLIYKKQYITNITPNTSQNGFVGILPRIGLNISEVLKVEFGMNYSQYFSNNYFTPFASMALKLGNSISLLGEFKPHADLLSSSSFLKDNPYINSQSFNTSYVRYNNALKIAMKYEYEKYFQINAGIKALSSTEMPYFKTSTTSGQFDLAYDDIRIFTAFTDMLFHLGPYGYFYGNVELTGTNDTAGYKMPYMPASTASLIYGYNLSMIKLDSEIRLNYSSGVYTDIPNSTQLGNRIDLGLKLTYQYKPMFFFTLEFSNLLFKDNYKWAGYQEMPFNAIAGISIVW
ncbi:MAG: hypothetical protein P4L27_09725 [Ignavibacteriaceae bacterium]|nr:hypothetical protein [Ignavibacteriaceae bacterium]